MMSQAALAEAAGISLSTIGRLERGLPVTAAVQGRIENALRWRRGAIDELFRGGEPEDLPGKPEDGVRETGVTRDVDQPCPDSAPAFPDPANYQDEMAYFDAVYWYQRGLGRSHAAVMHGFRMAAAAYLRNHPEDTARIVDDQR